MADDLFAASKALRREVGVYVGDPEPEWTGPDPLLEMMKKARPICRKPRGHDARLREALEIIAAERDKAAADMAGEAWDRWRNQGVVAALDFALAHLRAALGEEPTRG